MKKISKILVPVDFSPGSMAAWETALSLAQSTYGTVEIELLHVWEGEESRLPELTLRADKRGTATKLLTETRAHGMSLEHAARFLEELEREGFEIVARMKRGDVVGTIIHAAVEGNFDLIVIGTHGRSGLGALLGSVAEKVVHNSPIPVLTARISTATAVAATG